MEHIRQFMSRINPKVSFGVDAAADFTLSLELTPKKDDVDEILQLPEKSPKRKDTT